MNKVSIHDLTPMQFLDLVLPPGPVPPLERWQREAIAKLMVEPEDLPTIKIRWSRTPRAAGVALVVLHQMMGIPIPAARDNPTST